MSLNPVEQALVEHVERGEVLDLAGNEPVDKAGLDLGTPLLTTGTRARCDTTSSTAGQILAVSGWTLRLLAWAFATLFIAGFTGAVRKT